MGRLRRGLRGGRGGGRRRRSNCLIIVISMSISDWLIFIILSLVLYITSVESCMFKRSGLLPIPWLEACPEKRSEIQA